MIEVKNIHKRFGKEEVLTGLSFQHSRHQTLSILGESGSGKSTLLKIIAGLESADNGEIRVDGDSIIHKKPKERGVVYLYQEPLLFPHMTVTENIRFGLTFKKQTAGEIKEKTREMIDRLKLTGQEGKYPHQLSGGQKQRVAFGRAFIIRPKILLLDEPFASLDSGTREEMQILYKEVTDKEKITTLFVTHDLKEALITGDKFGLMSEGRLALYENRHEFINDSKTGVKQEIEFWKNLS